MLSRLLALAGPALALVAAPYTCRLVQSARVRTKTDDGAAATFRFASIHSDNMVLQAAPLRAIVWGFGGGADVEVSVDGGSAVKAVRSSWHEQDTWLAKLPTLPAGLSAHTVVATSGAAKATLEGVLFGDVFVCAGQSNMNYPLNSMTLPGKPGKVECWDAANVNCTIYNDTTVQACKKRKGVGCSQCHYGCVNNSQAEIDDMVNYDKILRMNVVAESGSHFPVTVKPMAESVNTGWLPPSKMGGGFSAACYFWARDMAKVLDPPRPIGLLQASVGGTSLQFWSSDNAIAQCQRLNKTWEWPANFRTGRGNLSTGYKLPDVPTGWNAKIVPLLRTAIRGAVWYQGESNTGLVSAGGDTRQYNCSFQSLIKDWRSQWHSATDGASDPTFAFGWIQLNSCNRAIWEESRTVPAVELPTNWSYQNPKVKPGPGDPLGAWTPTSTSSECHAGQPRGTPCRGQGDGFPSVRWAFQSSLVVPRTFQAVILDTPSAYGSVHSPFKQPAGSRLARSGLAVIYNLSSGVDPVVESVELRGTASVVVTLSGLGPDGIEPPRAAAGFELLCAGVWHSALIDASAVANNTITLPVPAGCSAPHAIRYIWYDTPCGNFAYQCPIYTTAKALDSLSGELTLLPLGPFIQSL